MKFRKEPVPTPSAETPDIEAKMLRLEARQMLERQEENFAEHVYNLYKFKDLFKGLEGKWEYQEMLETLSVRAALAADLKNEAERLVREDEEMLKDVGER